ncbi:hypothetical protein ABB02_01210 [Clostridiaceae bacterium JG1575]|nr:hypothetical protein ABB02_01210 [Clostridiaceae bacterium JG1575]
MDGFVLTITILAAGLVLIVVDAYYFISTLASIQPPNNMLALVEKIEMAKEQALPNGQ